MTRWARTGLTLFLAFLAYRVFHDEYGTVPLVSDIDVAVHEFGHVLFMPFGIEFLGHTMMVLGGSLFQVVFPLIFTGYFLARREDGRRRDVYGASVCLWWTSINLLGVAIYANDSRAGALMLINGLTGQDSDAHDWKYLFTKWGVLDKDTVIAGRMRAAAVLLCVASIVAGLYIAWTAADSAQGLLAEGGDL